MSLPFLNPALLGIAFASGLLWTFAAPERLRHPLIAVGIGAAAGCTAALAGLVPWLGTLTLAWHGIIMGCAFLAAWGIVRLRSRKVAIPEGFTNDQLLIAIIGGIVGARAWYVIERWHAFSHGADGQELPLGTIVSRAADIDGGGMVWYGGFLLATTAMVLHARRCRVALPQWADVVAPAVVAALAIGRIGCFVNGCCYGLPSDLPWAYHHHDVAGNPCTVHPTQLYEVVAMGLFAGGLCVWSAWSTLLPGMVGATALIGAGSWRFLNEMLRGDSTTPFTATPLHVTNAQWTSLAVAIVGAIWLAWIRLKRA